MGVVPVVGLEKFCVAKIKKDDSDGIEFEIPKYFAGIKEIGIKPKVTNDEFYAENMLWMSDTTLEQIDVEINITDLTDEDEAFLLGHKLSSTGGVIYGANDKGPEVAILFKANKGNGKGRFIVFYKGTFSISDESYKGKEGKSNFQAKKLKATFAPLHFNKMWKYKIDEDSINAPENLETKFFEKVIIPVEKTVAAQ